MGLEHFGDPRGFYNLDRADQIAVIAHHRITNAPPKKQKTGMSASDAAQHFAKQSAIKKAIKKRDETKGG